MNILYLTLQFVLIAGGFAVFGRPFDVVSPYALDYGTVMWGIFVQRILWGILSVALIVAGVCFGKFGADGLSAQIGNNWPVALFGAIFVPAIIVGVRANQRARNAA